MRIHETQRRQGAFSGMPIATRRRMARKYRALGPSFVSPEWANADQLDEAIEHETGRIMADPNSWHELVTEHGPAAGLPAALKRLQAAIDASEQPHANGADRGRVDVEAANVNDCLTEAAAAMAAEALDR